MSLSKHIPEVAGSVGDLVPAAGTLIIDTGLRELIGFSCSLAEDAASTAASVSWELVALVPGGTQKVTLKLWESDATVGTTAAKVSWTALGN